jgi:hypothetical protein
MGTQYRLEKPVLITGTSASACCPAAYEYMDLPNTGSAAVPRSRARRSAARARQEGEGPRRAGRTYCRRRNDVPPTRRRPELSEPARFRICCRSARGPPSRQTSRREGASAARTRAHTQPGRRSGSPTVRAPASPVATSPEAAISWHTQPRRRKRAAPRPPRARCPPRATRTSCPRRRRANV